MRRSRLFTLGVVVMAVALWAPAGFADLIYNGDFETPIVSGGFASNVTGSYLTGWTIADGNIDHIRTYWSAADGSQSLDMNGSGPGTITQQIATVVGATYKISFALSGNPEYDSPAFKTMDVKVLGANPIPDYSGSYSFDISVISKPLPGHPWTIPWENKFFTFTATSNLSTLEFISTTTGPCGPALDNVQGSQIPLPPTVLLLGSGLLGLGLLRRKWSLKK